MPGSQSLSLFEVLTVIGVVLSFVFVVVVPFVVGIVSRGRSHELELQNLREKDLPGRVQSLESTINAHVESDATAHSELQTAIANHATESGAGIGELKATLAELRDETIEGRRLIHADFNQLRERVGELRGEITGLRHVIDRTGNP